jgi:3-dehydroquinate synthase
MEGYENYSHGTAVAIGILVAAEISELECGLGSSVKERLKNLTLKLLPRIQLETMNASELWLLVRHDKKKQADRIIFTLIEDLGKPLMMPVAQTRFEDAFNKVREELSQ